MAFVLWALTVMLSGIAAFYFGQWQQNENAGWFMFVLLLLVAPSGVK